MKIWGCHGDINVLYDLISLPVLLFFFYIKPQLGTIMRFAGSLGTGVATALKFIPVFVCNWGKLTNLSQHENYIFLSMNGSVMVQCQGNNMVEKRKWFTPGWKTRLLLKMVTHPTNLTRTCQTHCATSPSVINFDIIILIDLKLKQYELSLQDCERVLIQEECNVKALLRSGSIYLHQQNMSAVRFSILYTTLYLIVMMKEKLN